MRKVELLLTVLILAFLVSCNNTTSNSNAGNNQNSAKVNANQGNSNLVTDIYNGTNNSFNANGTPNNNRVVRTTSNKEVSTGNIKKSNVRVNTGLDISTGGANRP